MARPPGSPKYGGRQKGTPNKRNHNQHLIEIAQRLDVNPFEVLCHFAKGDWKALGFESKTTIVYGPGGSESIEENIPIQLRLKAAMEMAQYLYPKKRSIEIKTDLSPEEQMIAQMVRERLEEYAAKQKEVVPADQPDRQGHLSPEEDQDLD